MKRSAASSETIDEQLERLVELESELEALDSTNPTIVRGPVHERATVAAASRVSHDAIPANYPVPVTTERALRLSLETDDSDRLAVYLEWPEQLTPTDQLARLLVELDIPADSFADLFGEEVALRTMDGHYVAAIAPRPGFRTDRWYYGVLAGELAWIVLDLWEFSGLPINATTGTIALAMLVVFPLATYNDAKYVAERTDWSPQAIMWTVGTALIAVNVIVGAIYLFLRRRAVERRY